jgi:signal transduction histidine kinase/ActR/RegA family two-component response regulator
MSSGSDLFATKGALVAPATGWNVGGPHSHSVQFYESDNFLVDSLSRWFDDGLSRDGSCIFIGTDEHRAGLEERLSRNGINLASLRQHGRYTCLDASETLSRFMVDGWPEEALFKEAIDRVLDGASHHGQVRAFGEMVALLWANGNRHGALRLEEIWNAYMATRSFSLCCAYPLKGFGENDDPALFMKVCEQHGPVLPAESYSELTTPAERLRSISLLQQKAMLLERTIGELADADRLKNEFLAMLGHELRNPLAAVLDAVATAEVDAPRRERALAIARRQAEQLARLMDDLLDVGRITQGKIALKKEPVAVGTILNQAIEEAQCLITAGRHQLNLEIEWAAAARWLEADPARLRQVIGNLIHNAVKFTPPSGRIDVRAECHEDSLVLTVRDTGAGISADLLPHVFDLFTQAERSLDRSHGGLGIGLTIVKRLVEMHGGSVDAASEGPGLGSKFTVNLPLIPVTSSQSTTAIENANEPLRRLKILIVEDNPDAAEALSMLLEVLGHSPTIVAEGTTAVKAAGEGHYNLALVDIGLPQIDGYEVARRIKLLPAARKMMMVALTGYGQDSDKRLALAAGFDDHLTKPVKIDRLEELLVRAARE